jgi:hypothetical protein
MNSELVVRCSIHPFSASDNRKREEQAYHQRNHSFLRRSGPTSLLGVAQCNAGWRSEVRVAAVQQDRAAGGAAAAQQGEVAAAQKGRVWCTVWAQGSSFTRNPSGPEQRPIRLNF